MINKPKQNIVDINFIQIGFQKCGTTFFQNSVYSQHPEINCIPVDRHKDIDELFLKKIILQDGLEYNQEEFEIELTKLWQHTQNHNLVNGMIFEPFTFLYTKKFDRKNVIDRIHKNFPNIKIVTCIRNQKTWILSHYSQYIKAGGLLSLDDFIYLMLNNPHLDGHYVDWYQLVSYLIKIFGKSNVFVCVYEELKDNPQLMANKVFKFLEVQDISISSSVINPSLSKQSIYLKRLFNYFVRYDCGASIYSYHWDYKFGIRPKPHSKVFAIKYRFYRLKQLANKLCYTIDNLLKFSGKLELNNTQYKEIQAKYLANNMKLSKLIKSDLSKYNYF